MVSTNPTSWKVLDPIFAPPSCELYKNKTISEDLTVVADSEDQPQSPHGLGDNSTYLINPRTQGEDEGSQDYSFSLMPKERNHKRRPRPSDLNRVYAEPEPMQQYFPMPASQERLKLPYQSLGRPMPDPKKPSLCPRPMNGLRAQISYLQEKVLKLEGKPVNPVGSKYKILYRIEKDNKSRRMGREWDIDESFRSPWMGTFTDPPEDQSLNAKYGKPAPFSETILPVSEELNEVFEEMLRGQEFSSMYHGYQSSRKVTTPYLFGYHNRSKVAVMRHGLRDLAQQQLNLFMDYVQETCGEEYATADSLLNKGHIRPEYVQYLFRPNEILVSNNNNEYTGYMAVDWLLQHEGYFGSEQTSSWIVKGQTWQFDGSLMAV
ncbi:hypothetical protein PENANT_c019G01513 [Penicillium antarcticum]|uniref:Uncharacterized protein n=1 Tax=Penicillium antarcticum TaxID=416450 RepID=A0A1V6Q115_9EURO|nr:hypothetical protein PENANT_c019G01513 [Penicillium antarcticum]